MFRIKRLTAAILCLLLTAACAESDSLISEEMIRDETVHYDTVAVELGTFERSVSTSASDYYPVTCTVRYEGVGARFVEYLVERKDEVKKGDVLATFDLDFDEVGYAEAQLELEQLQADALRAEERAQAEIEALAAGLLKASSPADKAFAQLRIERAEIERVRTADSYSRKADAVRGQIAEMDAQKAAAVLLAPMDGVVTEMESKRAGDEVAEGEALITICREDIVLLAIENPAGAFRYGAELTIEVGWGKDRSELSGRVVAVDTVAPAAERKGYALAEFENPDGVKPIRMTAMEAMIRVENVMLVPRRAVNMDGGKYYVTLLENGAPQKRFINCVFSSSAQNVWVLQGLEIGDEIVVD